MNLSFLINFNFSKFKEIYEEKVEVLQRNNKMFWWFLILL